MGIPSQAGGLLGSDSAVVFAPARVVNLPVRRSRALDKHGLAAAELRLTMTRQQADRTD
jgi:hypothetical protein